MRFSRYIAKRIFSALNACIHKLWNILFHSVPARDRKNEVLEVQCKHLTVLSAIRKLNLFSSLITGKTSYFNSTALLIGLALISCCSSLPVSMPKDFVRSFRTLVDWYFRILGEVFSNLSFLKFPSDLVFFFLNLAATYSPTPSPVQYHRPFRS